MAEAFWAREPKRVTARGFISRPVPHLAMEAHVRKRWAMVGDSESAGAHLMRVPILTWAVGSSEGKLAQFSRTELWRGERVRHRATTQRARSYVNTYPWRLLSAFNSGFQDGL